MLGLIRGVRRKKLFDSENEGSQQLIDITLNIVKYLAPKVITELMVTQACNQFNIDRNRALYLFTYATALALVKSADTLVTQERLEYISKQLHDWFVQEDADTSITQEHTDHILQQAYPEIEKRTVYLLEKDDEMNAVFLEWQKQIADVLANDTGTIVAARPPRRPSKGSIGSLSPYKR